MSTRCLGKCEKTNYMVGFIKKRADIFLHGSGIISEADWEKFRTDK